MARYLAVGLVKEGGDTILMHWGEGETEEEALADIRSGGCDEVELWDGHTMLWCRPTSELTSPGPAR